MTTHRYAKIVATLGPSSTGYDEILALAQAGANVFRFNFSHGTHADHRLRMAFVREVEGVLGHPLAVLADLQGPKLRIGSLEPGHLDLAEGDQVIFTPAGKGDVVTDIPLPHPEIFSAARPGVVLLIDDGKMRFEVVQADDGHITARTIVGGCLLPRKGVSVVGATLPVSALTPKDYIDLKVALELGVDWIALSFVQRPEDIDELRNLAGPHVRIMAKIEKPSAVDCLEQIVERSDGIMVARGDLGVEMPVEMVPRIQRRILSTCRRLGKPVVVATQMLESMIAAATPTRAEVSDVATAIYAGADAVMLSAESASGRFPRQAVEMMASIIGDVEADEEFWKAAEKGRVVSRANVSDVICAALRETAKALQPAAIVAYTTSGNTGFRASAERPRVPLLCLVPSLEVARPLCLSWGVRPRVTAKMNGMTDVLKVANCLVLNEGVGREGQLLALTAGQPFGVAGTTNVLRVERIAR
ncbi:pyruvate kinase [Acidocella aminolytica]|uniref:Pyruvate kinase n=1 Tax=Acidocella aminolytica 101 = DSM 11237 TaxID=1120923 RepID=A0A0D6PCM1_9PROT|nr:pyruvate kinase [Acidocella aminolytica]GAN79515.1 pyruvate kinase [Acidocella aminolytica 101 = DSM 11237]GBQ32614.1 pyruvate kinase [Acidocella aminolytica 101 = DSM 11237]SHF34778.1 pyruvate kinase [Acidocella aminolytica 101 = DSM 11237]